MMPDDDPHTIHNLDPKTVSGFGAEWSRFDQSKMTEQEAQETFDSYFSLCPPHTLPSNAVVMDVGCGSGRWSRFVAPHVSSVHLIDPSNDALDVARRNLADFTNCTFHHSSVDDLPCADESVDLVYSLGVLHHVPDTGSALRDCAKKVKPGGKLLVYLYYRFDNRPRWFQVVWRISDLGRMAVCRMPFFLKRRITDVIAVVIYWPLARLSGVAEGLRRNVSRWPLSAYRHKSLYVMRTDALDRFGTRVEQRFTRAEISKMLTDAGLADIRFRDTEPFWCAIGTKSS